MNASFCRNHAIVGHPGGLRLLPLIGVWTAACAHKADVKVLYEDRRANAKLLLDLVQLAAPPESLLVIEATGPDAVEAVSHVRRLIESEEVDAAPTLNAFDPERHPVPQSVD
jgi:phosphotransferase system HPr-like phosphotransfer protein